MKRFQVRLNPNGIFSVASATAYETQIVDEPAGPLTPAPGEPMDQGQPPQVGYWRKKALKIHFFPL